MINNFEIYKIYQLFEVFVNEYDYKQTIIQDYKSYANQELWLVNPSNVRFPLIRISIIPSCQFEYDKSRINTYINYFKNELQDDNLGFLDIHISKDPYLEDDEDYDFVNMDSNYVAGYDIEAIFPRVINKIHDVDDVHNEINEIVNRIANYQMTKMKNKRKLLSNSYLVTYIIMGICLVMFLIQTLLSLKYNTVSSMIFLGAEYKTFTLGLRQLYRLFTYAFLHGSFFHLYFNMLSFYNLGRYIESKYGKKNLLIILFVSIIFGSLTQGVVVSNSICVGLSAGIYGLLVVYLLDVIKTRRFNKQALIYNLIINIGICFFANIAIMAHVGGAIAGLLMYYFLNQKKKALPFIALVAVLYVLLFKYASLNNYVTYPVTDMEVIEIYKFFKLDNYANKLWLKLLDIYNR